MKFTKINMFVCSVLASAPPTLRDVGFGYPHHGTSPTPTAAAGTLPPLSAGGGEGSSSSSENGQTRRESGNTSPSLFLLLVSCYASTVRDIPCCLYSLIKQNIELRVSLTYMYLYICLQVWSRASFSPHEIHHHGGVSSLPHYL